MNLDSGNILNEQSHSIFSLLFQSYLDSLENQDGIHHETTSPKHLLVVIVLLSSIWLHKAHQRKEYQVA